MVTLSCLSKKNQNLNPRKKKFSWVLKMEICWFFKPQTSIFSTKLNFFFLGFKFWFFFVKQLKVAILDNCISLNSVQKILVVLEVVDMCLLLLRSHLFHNHNVLHFLTLWALMAKIIFARVLDMVLRRVLHFPQDWMWPSQAFISCFLLSTSLCPGSRVGSGLSLFIKLLQGIKHQN